MADKNWKKMERRVAKFFGTVRNSLSGGNSKMSRSDSLHPDLFIECKLSKAQAIWTLYDKTKNIRAQAMMGDKDKTIVLCMQEPNRKGFLVVMHCDDLEKVSRAREIARTTEYGF